MFDKVIASVDKKLERFDPIWRARNGVGGQRDRYYDKTGVAKYREWRGVKDTLVDYAAWLKNIMFMMQMVGSAPGLGFPCPVIDFFYQVVFIFKKRRFRYRIGKSPQADIILPSFQ